MASITHKSSSYISAMSRVLPRFNRLWYATDDSLFRYIPHAFSKEDAAKRFYKSNSERYFAPINIPTGELAISESDPLQKMLIPIQGVNVEVISTRYTGEYGRDRLDVSYKNGKMRTKTKTDWYPIDGTLGGCKYTQEDPHMSIYSGFKWDAVLIEGALEGHSINHLLAPFNPQDQNDKDTLIDPFLKRASVAREIAESRLFQQEKRRARQKIEQSVRCDHVRIDGIAVSFKPIEINPYYLPAYILKSGQLPPQVLPALSKGSVKVYGSYPLSTTKLAAVGLIAGIAATYAFPQISLPARLGWIAISSLSAGGWARYRSVFQNYTQQKRITRDKELNDSVSETTADRQRRLSTQEIQQLDIDRALFHILGLNPSQSISEKIVIQAFHKRLAEVHPDHQKDKDLEVQAESNRKTMELIAAKEKLLGAIRNKYDGKRYYSTIQPPRSTRDSRVHELITAVLDQKDYPKALRLVKEKEIHPDAHDAGENTLLSEAAKRGDIQAMYFAVRELGASPDTSCDCPAHRTPLHYAASRGDAAATKVLLDLGANPNLINTFGETALDVAVKKQQTEVIDLLKKAESVAYVTGGSLKGLARSAYGAVIGYGSADRTLALPEQKYVPKALPSRD